MVRRSKRVGPFVPSLHFLRQVNLEDLTRFRPPTTPAIQTIPTVGTVPTINSCGFFDTFVNTALIVANTTIGSIATIEPAERDGFTPQQYSAKGVGSRSLIVTIVAIRRVARVMHRVGIVTIKRISPNERFETVVTVACKNLSAGCCRATRTED